MGPALWTGWSPALDRPKLALFAKPDPGPLRRPLPGVYVRGPKQGDARRRPEGAMKSPDPHLWLPKPDKGPGGAPDPGPHMSDLLSRCTSSPLLPRRRQKPFKLQMWGSDPSLLREQCGVVSSLPTVSSSLRWGKQGYCESRGRLICPWPTVHVPNK